MASRPYTCSSCGLKMRVPERYFGRRLRCTGCGHRFIIDAPAKTTTVSTSTTAPASGTADPPAPPTEPPTPATPSQTSTSPAAAPPSLPAEPPSPADTGNEAPQRSASARPTAAPSTRVPSRPLPTPGTLRTAPTPRRRWWQDRFLHAAVVIALMLVMLWLLIPTPEQRFASEREQAPIGTRFTVEVFRQIRPGMTYSEVVQLLGEEGVKLGEDSEEERLRMFAWSNPDGSRLTVLFEDGEVRSTSELGLPTSE